MLRPQGTTAAILRLVDGLSSQKRATRRNAADSLWGIGNEAVAAAQTILLRRLKDCDTGVRRSAIGAIGELRLARQGVAESRVLAALLEALCDENSDIGATAANCIYSLGADAVAAAVKVFLERWRSPGIVGRATAVRALGAIVTGLPDPSNAVWFELDHKLAHEGLDSDEVAEAALVVKVLLPDPVEAAALLDGLRKPDRSVRARAAEELHACLWGRRPGIFAEAVAALLDALSDTDAAIRKNAVADLWALGCSSRYLLGENGMARVAKEITRLLQHDADAEVREIAAEAFSLGTFAKAAPDLVASALVQALRSETDSRVRRSICRVLGDIAAAAKAMLEKVVPVLVEVGESDPSGSVQTTAILALESARPRGRGLSRPAVRRSDLVIAPTKQRRRRPKRERAETFKSLLALLNTCLNWPCETVSERQLRKSTLLREERKRLGLPESVSAGTVHNHLQTLARVCKVERLFDPEPKNQFSTFCTGVKARLAQKRPDLEDEIARLDEKVGLLARPERLAPPPPEPDAIA